MRQQLSKSKLAVVLTAVLLTIANVTVARIENIADAQGLALVGEARMKVLLWKIYDARLYAPNGTWSKEAPYALSLTYLMDLEGERIAERSVQEMRKQGLSDEVTLARWYELLAEIIPNVREQNEIVGLANGKGATQFYLDGEEIGSIPEPAFTEAFFAIWLGEGSSEPELRDQLLGAQR